MYLSVNFLRRKFHRLRRLPESGQCVFVFRSRSKDLFEVELTMIKYLL